MVSMSLNVSEELRSKMNKFSWINWSEVAREEAIGHEEKLALLDELEELTKHSKMTDKDCLRLGKLVNKGISKRLS